MSTPAFTTRPRASAPALRPRPARLASAALPADSQVSDGAVIERLVRMRAACQALASELAGTRRELRVVQAELRRLQQRR